jgi:hypothetical protein
MTPREQSAACRRSGYSLTVGCEADDRLTCSLILAQCFGRCFKTPNQRNPHPIACGFFTPIGFASMGGMGRIQHLRGELGRRLVTVLNARPPASKRDSKLNQE